MNAPRSNEASIRLEKLTRRTVSLLLAIFFASVVAFYFFQQRADPFDSLAVSEAALEFVPDQISLEEQPIEFSSQAIANSFESPSEWAGVGSVQARANLTWKIHISTSEMPQIENNTLMVYLDGIEPLLPEVSPSSIKIDLGSLPPDRQIEVAESVRERLPMMIQNTANSSPKFIELIKEKLSSHILEALRARFHLPKEFRIEIIIPSTQPHEK
ncbi:MAG: hypothetical protein N2578_01880 [Bdellovibrionaceae bacterium]|nr:hypothetical protein [Pseudobdellovibrionaceae bacterium]